MKLSMLSLALALAGCASPPPNPPVTATPRTPIAEGSTTLAELVTQYGLPTAKGKDSQGRAMVTWTGIRATANDLAYIPGAGAFLKSTDVVITTLKVSLSPENVVLAKEFITEKRASNIFDSNK